MAPAELELDSLTALTRLELRGFMSRGSPRESGYTVPRANTRLHIVAGHVMSACSAACAAHGARHLDAAAHAVL